MRRLRLTPITPKFGATGVNLSPLVGDLMPYENHVSHVTLRSAQKAIFYLLLSTNTGLMDISAIGRRLSDAVLPYCYPWASLRRRSVADVSTDPGGLKVDNVSKCCF